MRQPSVQLEKLAYRVIGAAIEVHQVLGAGFLEEVYHKALREEFLMREIPHKFEHPVKVTYKGRPVGEGKLDFLARSAEAPHSLLGVWDECAGVGRDSD
jgi:hypothetical protein